MDILEKFEARLGELLVRLKDLEEENQLLKMEIDEARKSREEVLERVTSLLHRVQEETSSK